MTYEEARVYLDEVSKYGSVLGLDTIRELLYELGNPQNELKFIHIAGTNGKGSVLAYISTILSETGFRVGRYVSPTVIGYLEKIQINGDWISEKVFTELVEEVQRAIVRMETNGKASPTVFEVETAIAFLYFKREHCDYVVLETGLGGILDATNIYGPTSKPTGYTSSDKTLKENVKPLKYSLAEINRLNVYEFSYQDEPDVRRIGVIAQELKKVIPEAVDISKKESFTINPDWVFYTMFNAVKELDKTVESCKSSLLAYAKEYQSLSIKMKSLEKEQKQLEKERKSLEKQINKAYRKAEKMEKSA